MKHYVVNPQVKMANFTMRSLLRLGLAPRHTYLLTVAGRKTGALYSTPVTLVEYGDTRWLVAPYGEVDWVRNARVAGEVILSRRGRSERVSIVNAALRECGPVLKKYIALEPITRPYFDANPDSPAEAFEAEASRHPVFRITESRPIPS